MIVYHCCSYKKLTKYLTTGYITPPVRAWENIEQAERMSLSTGRRLILRLHFPSNAPKLEGHFNEIYIAADKSKCGHLVIDVKKYAVCDDIVTQPFTAQGKYGLDLEYFIPKEIYRNEPNRIDKFKLTMVRYYRCDEVPLPNWIPKEIIEMRASL